MLNQDGHFYVCGSARQVPEDIYTAMKEAPGAVGPGGCGLEGNNTPSHFVIKHCSAGIRVSRLSQVMMAHQRCGEEDAEAILSNLKMEGRLLSWGWKKVCRCLLWAS